MTTAASAGSEPIQATLPYADKTKKRTRSKYVTWASDEKLNQVRLFAAEDAPSVSGSVLQELLEAKKTKFMHVLVPVSVDDLPPGFGGIAPKGVKLDSAAIFAMVAQITWRVPEKFLYDSLWQVARGDESSEAKVQRQRELRLLEAIYPRPSAVPSSSLEPSETPTVLEESQILEIPLIPVDDEDDGPEENSVPGSVEASKSATFPSDDSLSGLNRVSTYPPGYPPCKESQNFVMKGQSKSGSSSAAAQFNSDAALNFLNNADPDVAAAAAAAYAVVKAKESGALIDHELLINILSNPVLIESLTASYPSLRQQFGEISSSNRGGNNGNRARMRYDQSLEGPLTAVAGHMNTFYTQGDLNTFYTQGRQRYDAPGFTDVQPWASNASALAVSQGRGYHMAGAHEMSGHARAYGKIGPPGRQYPIERSDSRGLAQQHGLPGIFVNEAQFRQSAAPVMVDEVMLDRDSERYLLGQPWPGMNLNGPPLVGMGRHTVASHDRPGGPKMKKQCLFFNTLRGCRNGIYCPFLHEAAPEKHVGEKVPTSDSGKDTKSPASGDSNSDGEAK